tara:strand:+ start:1242 stop:1820 length:579 start_codon:yes stop_codon:yes gene_type:complete
MATLAPESESKQDLSVIPSKGLLLLPNKDVLPVLTKTFHDHIIYETSKTPVPTLSISYQNKLQITNLIRNEFETTQTSTHAISLKSGDMIWRSVFIKFKDGFPIMIGVSNVFNTDTFDIWFVNSKKSNTGNSLDIRIINNVQYLCCTDTLNIPIEVQPIFNVQDKKWLFDKNKLNSELIENVISTISSMKLF